jgi:hypothetical protein
MKRALSRAASPVDAHRRRFLQQALVGAGVMAGGVGLWRASTPRATAGPLAPAALARAARDRVRTEVGDTSAWIPRGTVMREVARSGTPPVAGHAHRWHADPDGGATFAAADGGWIYVSNSEVDTDGGGSVGALRFDREGELRAAYPICEGTRNNCAGGPTPWGTWLSCEEFDRGRVFECDPHGERDGVERPALGTFTHEAIAVDPVRGHLFLTEDQPDGRLYRFTPHDWPIDARPSLDAGRLEVAVLTAVPGRGPVGVRWAAVADRDAVDRPTRGQVPQSSAFDGGEGIWYHSGAVYFATKGDNRVWHLDPATDRIEIVYERGALEPAIADVDNVTVSARGEVLVAEDGPAMRLVVLGPAMRATPVVEFAGHRDSEICGPAFSPDGDRLYFSSQRGPIGRGEDGRTYELAGLLAVV